MKYGNLTLGQIEALLNVLGGMDAVKAVLSGEKKVVLTDTFGAIYIVGDREWFTEMSGFYRAVFNETVDFSDLAIPRDPGGFAWGLPIVEGMTANRAWAVAEKLFRCYSYAGDDLDKVVLQNERTTDRGSYIIRVRDRVEADEELKNHSAFWIAEQKLATMTLTERIVLELWYFWKFKKHLDIRSTTFCTGSRFSDGSVPCTYWRTPPCSGSAGTPPMRTRAATCGPVPWFHKPLILFLYPVRGRAPNGA